MKKALIVVMLLIVVGIQSTPNVSACWYGKCTSVKRRNGCTLLYRTTGGIMPQYQQGWCRPGSVIVKP